MNQPECRALVPVSKSVPTICARASRDDSLTMQYHQRTLEACCYTCILCKAHARHPRCVRPRNTLPNSGFGCQLTASCPHHNQSMSSPWSPQGTCRAVPESSMHQRKSWELGMLPVWCCDWPCGVKRSAPCTAWRLPRWPLHTRPCK